MQPRGVIHQRSDSDFAGPRCLLPDAQWRRLAAHFRLSPREAEVVRGIMEGECEPSTARRLGISPHTVHTHVMRAYRKLLVHSRSELVLRIASAAAELMRSDLRANAPTAASSRGQITPATNGVQA